MYALPQVPNREVMWMAKVSRTYRFDEALVERVAAYAVARGSTATDVFAAGAEMLLGVAEGGVLDLPAEPYKLPPSKPAPKPAVVPSRIPGVVRARSLAPGDPVSLGRQARLNRGRGS